eukprot:TRINITY_DN10743_c0_g2_i1.p1 TRINITY_DN10743_c0_g2~~TRINITY_DN10743_c0_g2_i1.p1  ORF type:complete len:634 (+),score=172.95 TRINITY_DN10743_c0_g2_i1:67-1902(+)
MSRHYKDPSEWRDVRDLFKTKLCTLFSRGHCPRDRCNFAHGEEELRKVPPASANDRYQGGRHGDRRRSPSFRRRSPDYSPRKGRRSYSPLPRRRSKSPSDLLQEDGPNKRRKRDDDAPPDDDVSEDIEAEPPESEKKEDEVTVVRDEEMDNDRIKEKEKEKDKEKPKEKPKEEVPTAVREVKDGPLREELLMKLKALEDEVSFLESNKSRIEGHVERKEKKNMELQDKMAEIESQLEEAEERTRRATSRLKRVMKAHIKVSKTQEELKRWQSKLNKLAEEAQHEHEDHPVGVAERDRHGTDGFVSEDGLAGSDGDGDPRKVSVRNLHINLNQLPGTYSPVGDSRRRQDREDLFPNLESKRSSEKGRNEGARNRDEGQRSLEQAKMEEEYQFDDVEMTPKRKGAEDSHINKMKAGEAPLEKEQLLRERREAVKEALAQTKAAMERQQASQGRNRDEDSQGAKEGNTPGARDSNVQPDEGAAATSPEDSAFPKNALALASSKISFQLKGDKIGFKAIRPPIPAVLLGNDKDKLHGNGLGALEFHPTSVSDARPKRGTDSGESPSFLPLSSSYGAKGNEEEEVDVDSMDDIRGDGSKMQRKNAADSPVDMDLQD